MLGALEQRIAAVIADRLADRAHLSVDVAPASLLPPEPDAAALKVNVVEVAHDSAFQLDRFGSTGPPEAPRSRRVLPLLCAVRLSFRGCPADDTAVAAVNARRRLLEDVALTAHRLDEIAAEPALLAPLGPGDPGFRVSSFGLETGEIGTELDAECLAAALRYQARVHLWPPDVTHEERPIRAVDTIAEALPARIVVTTPALPAGATTEVRIAIGAATRLADPASGARTPLQLALTVLSDVPPALRGSVVSGADGPQSGVRLQAVTPPETVVTYQAPDGPIDAPRLEYLAVHLATSDGAPGVFLGSAPLRLLAAAP
jgi:hypothetical protein